MTAYEWVQGDRETVETDLTTLDGAPADLDLTGRTVHFVLRHYTGAKVADKEASDSGTTATVELTPANLSRPSSHEAEWVITDGADDPTTFPKDEPIDVDVRPSVDDDDNVAEPIPEDAEVDVLTANGLNGSVTGDSLIESLVAANLGVDASDNLFVPDPAVVSALDGQAISPQELTLGSESAISGFEGALSVDANDNLVATDTDTDTQLTDEEVQDLVGAFVSGGTNATVTYDDSNDVLAVSAADTDTQLTDEEVQDIVGAFVSGGTNVTISYSDSGDVLTVSATDTDTQLSDSEVVTAVEDEPSKIDADVDQIDGYDIQKNGSDGQGVINLKTN